MTDREMLELAAKAMGFPEIRYQDLDGWGEDRYGFNEAIWTGTDYWNPRSNYKHAFTMAIQLKIRMEPTENYAVAYAGSVCAEKFTERNGDNAVLAMCRAVTRAAAEIGRNMP